MLKLAVDENFNGRILRGLRRALPDIDVVRIQVLVVSAGRAGEWEGQVLFLPL
jgi:hypothetical protein